MTGAADLVRQIVAGGGLTDPAWRDAFAAVPREVFVPAYFAALGGGPDDGGRRLWRDDPDPARRAQWHDGVYDDVPLATRLRDGELVSSSSQPSLMARMLQALDVADGMRVLEIGTGSGYNAALLSRRLGEQRVTSVEYDPDIATAARSHLREAGYRPSVVTGDGALGCPAHAPYDRILATCAVRAVPPAWLEQCRPGGLVLTPLATGLLALRVAGPARGSGHFLDGPAFFVPLRGTPPPAVSGAVPLTGVPRRAQRADSFRFLLALTGGRVPPRAAYEIWRAERRPARERYGVTVRGDGQWAWLDAEDGPYVWPLPGS
ncbi:MAG TPA: methyltransferase domain-containing protein [Streptomyces sp.]|nr:methyltransferase domain-containing protein [Streptomyces sp.]